MRIFSYRNKRRAKKLLVVLLIAAGVLALFCAVRFIYLQRFLVYGNHSVYLNYDQDLTSQPQASPGWDRLSRKRLWLRKRISVKNPSISFPATI